MGSFVTEKNNYAHLSSRLSVTDAEPDRNLALELVRATEAAAIASSPWVGFGDKNAADGAAVDAMRGLLSTVNFNGVVVIGEGEKDEAPMLFNGEQVGNGSGAECDVAVDPIDGTRLTALGLNNALSVLAVADRGSMFDPSAVFYMEKLVTGPEAAELVDLRLPVKQNLHLIAKAKGKKISQVTVTVLDRPRHADLIEEIREAGARTKLILDGDVAGAIAATREGTGVDALMGIGGTPEGIVTACAIKALGGVIQGRLWPTDEAEKRGPRTGPRADHQRPGHLRQLLLRSHRHHRWRSAARRPLQEQPHPHPVDRDARQVRHHPLRRRRAQAGQVGRLHPLGP